ncbi:MAG: SCO family protein [Cytophagales bacterium]|nr:SCO family protein [Cytophagales bacterium]
MSNKANKAGILLFLLVVPVFVFLFLRFLTTAYFDVKKYYPIGTETVTRGGREVVDTLYHTIRPFSLTNQLGETFSSETLEGKLYVANFIFTRCETICPKMTSQLTRIQELYKNNSQMKIVSISVDPTHDTPEVLKEYAESYRVMNDKWFFLTGEKEKIYDIAFTDLKIDTLEQSNASSELIRSNKLVLIDWFGRIRGYYDGTDQKDVNRLQKEMQILLEQTENEKR